MNDIFKWFKERKLKPTPQLINDYIEEHGGAIIRTVRDEIFTDDANVSMDTDEIIVLDHPLANGELVDRVEVNPTFIVSITYVKPRPKIHIAN